MSSSAQALFAVVSPLQYVNALEAVKAFDLRPENCHLAVGFSRKNPTSYEQIMSLREEDVWASTTRLEGVPPAGRMPKQTLLRNLWEIAGARQYVEIVEELLERIGRLDLLFVGDYRPHNFRHLFARRPKTAAVWLLDDGSVTHQVAKYRIDPLSSEVFSKPFASAKNPKVQRLQRWGGLQFCEPESVGFFTCYDVRVAQYDHVRQHRYERFRERFGSLECNGETWFVGSNHVENSFTTLPKYMALLQKARAFYGSAPVYYLPHRGEAAWKIQLISDLGFTIKQTDLPLEIVVGKSRNYPKTLAGIASSVFDNLSVILGDRINIEIFEVGLGYSPAERWKHLQDVIDYHRRNLYRNTRIVSESLLATGSRAFGTSTVVFNAFLPASRDPSESGTFSGGTYYGDDGVLRGVDVSFSPVRGSESEATFRLLHAQSDRGWTAGDRVQVEDLDGAGIATRSGHVRSYDPTAGTLRVDLDEVDRGTAPDAAHSRWRLRYLGPRFDHQPRSNHFFGLLLEGPSTNEALHSEDLFATAYRHEGITPPGDGASIPNPMLVPSPDGLCSADLLVPTKGFSEHRVTQHIEKAGSGPVTVSVFAHDGGARFVRLRVSAHVAEADHFTSSQTESFEAVFDTNKKRLVAVHGTTGTDPRQAAVKTTSTDWSRLSVTGDLVAPAGYQVEVGFTTEQRETLFASDGVSGMYLWGLQFERTPSVSSYICTAGSPTPRGPSHLRFEVPDAYALGLDFRVPMGDSTTNLAEFDGSHVEYRGGSNEVVLVTPTRQYTAFLQNRKGYERHDLLITSEDNRTTVSLDGVAAIVAAEGPLKGDVTIGTTGSIHVTRVNVARLDEKVD